MILVISIVALLGLLFFVWWFRFRYPPLDLPQVLCYHKISDRFCFEGTWTTSRRFTDHIEHTAKGGFEFIDEDRYLRAVEERRVKDGRTVLLTFDDGYEALARLCRDVLAPRGVPVLIFLVTDFVGAENRWDLSLGRRSFRHLSWDQVRELDRMGVRFGSHSATHRDLTRLPEGELAREIAGSRERIAEETGRAPRCFSYPYGRTNDTVKAAVREAGYDAGFSLYPPQPNERVDRFALRRNGVYVIDTPFALDCKLERTAFSWFEEMKCRTINQVAVLTPLLKRSSAGPGS